MRRCNIQILLLMFQDSAICTPTAVFIRSRAWVTDGNLMGPGLAGHRLTTATATGFMGRNLAGPLLEANHGDGCLTTMAAGFLNLGSVGCGLPPDSAVATCPLNSTPPPRRLCDPAAPSRWCPLIRRIAAARRR